MKGQYLNVMLAVPFAASVLGAGEAAATPSACDAIAGNLVTNCGFETTTGWSPSVEQDGGGDQHTGSFAEFLGDAPTSSGFATQASVQQTITTMTGDTYTLTFWAVGFPLNLDVSFGGSSVFSQLTLPTNYEEFTATVTASSTSSVLEFANAGSGYGDIDDVSLVPTSPTSVPEPGSLALLAAGLAGLAGLCRRRR